MDKTTIQIPTELAPKLEAWGKMTVEIFGEIRAKSGLAPEGVPEDQKWFWTKEWQSGEREADQEIANGETIKFENMEDAINYLDDLP